MRERMTLFAMGILAGAAGPLWAQPRSAAPPALPSAAIPAVAPQAPLQAVGLPPRALDPQLGAVGLTLQARLQQYATWDAKAVAWALASAREVGGEPAAHALLRQAVALSAEEAGPLLAQARDAFGPSVGDGLASLRERVYVAAQQDEAARSDLGRIARRGAVDAVAANALLARAGEVARSLAQTLAPVPGVDASGARAAAGGVYGARFGIDGVTFAVGGAAARGPWSARAARWGGKTRTDDAREWTAQALRWAGYRGETRLAAVDLVERFVPILQRLRPPIQGVGDWARQPHAEVIADVGEESATIAVFLPGVHMPMAEPLSMGSALQRSLSRAGGVVGHGNVWSAGREGAAVWIKLPRRAPPSGGPGGPWLLQQGWVELAESIALQSRPLRSGGGGVADSRLGRVTSGENGALVFEAATRRGPLYGPRRWRRFEADRHTGALLSVSEEGLGGGWRAIPASNEDRERFIALALDWLSRRDPATGKLLETARRDDPDRLVPVLLRMAARAGGFLATGYAAIRTLDWIDPLLPAFPGASVLGISAVAVTTLLLLLVSSLGGQAAATLARNLWSPYPAAKEQRPPRIGF